MPASDGCGLANFWVGGMCRSGIDIDQIVRGEFAENAFRRDFLQSEVDAIRCALEPLEGGWAAVVARDGAGGVAVATTA